MAVTLWQRFEYYYYYFIIVIIIVIIIISSSSSSSIITRQIQSINGASLKECWTLGRNSFEAGSIIVTNLK